MPFSGSAYVELLTILRKIHESSIEYLQGIFESRLHQSRYRTTQSITRKEYTTAAHRYMHRYLYTYAPTTPHPGAYKNTNTNRLRAVQL